MSVHSMDFQVLARAGGDHYYDVLATMHDYLKPEWYLEIGTQTGRSLAVSKARSISVDPHFAIKHEVVANKPELHLCQQTSDDFFAGGLLGRLGASPDLAFIDGMHLYEFVLRDFMNTEAAMRPGGTIVLHDCLPWEPSMAQRDRARAVSRAWAGDVWKIVPILQAHRPDLDLRIYDAAPTGIVVIRNLDPESRVLQDRYDAITAEWHEREDVEAFVGAFDIRSTRDAPWAPRRPAMPAGPLDIAIKIPARNRERQERWGDYHFARGLERALQRLGHKASVAPASEWDSHTREGGVDLVLRGRRAAEPVPGRLQLGWFISGTPEGEAEKMENFDHVFVAGQPFLDALRRRHPGGHFELLPQAFDASVMAPPPPGTPRSGVVFVGIARNGHRPILRMAAASGTPVRIWGSGWADTEFADAIEAEHHDNAALPQTYGAAEVVLNDHRGWMRRRGLASNRIVDALACGAPVISDPVAWMPPDLAPFVHTASDEADFTRALRAIRAESPARREARHALAHSMRATHSFDARARRILETIGRPAI